MVRQFHEPLCHLCVRHTGSFDYTKRSVECMCAKVQKGVPSSLRLHSQVSWVVVQAQLCILRFWIESGSWPATVQSPSVPGPVTMALGAGAKRACISRRLYACPMKKFLCQTKGRTTRSCAAEVVGRIAPPNVRYTSAQ